MFRNDNRMITILTLIFLAVMMLILFSYINSSAKGEDAYIICQPDDVVLVREFPKKKSFASGELPPGTVVHLDGVKRNGYYHCVEMRNEANEGWVHSAYIVFEEPIKMEHEAVVISKGRLAVRKSINGKRASWLKPGDIVVVYFYTEEWCVTNKGYVKTKYLEFD